MLLLAGPSAAYAGAAIEIGVEDDHFSPARVSTAIGASDLIWIWDLDGSSGGTTQDPHNVVSRDGLFSSNLVDTGTYELNASAGSFAYFCTLHGGMTGRLTVVPTGLVAEAIPRPVARSRVERRTITVRWASRGSDTGNRFDVRFKVGKRDWRSWKDDTRRRKAVFGRNRRPVKVKGDRRYSFQARSQQGKGERKRSGWSPNLNVQL